MNEIILAEFGRFPLQIHFWQQVMRYQNRAAKLPPIRLVRLAFIDGLVYENGQPFDTYIDGSCRTKMDLVLEAQPAKLETLEIFNVSGIVKFQQQLFITSYCINTGFSSLTLHSSIQLDKSSRHNSQTMPLRPSSSSDRIRWSIIDDNQIVRHSCLPACTSVFKSNLAGKPYLMLGKRTEYSASYASASSSVLGQVSGLIDNNCVNSAAST